MDTSPASAVLLEQLDGLKEFYPPGNPIRKHLEAAHADISRKGRMLAKTKRGTATLVTKIDQHSTAHRLLNQALEHQG